MKLFTFFVLLLVATSAAVSADETTLRRTWTSAQYTAKPLPSAWRPKVVPPTARAVGEFLKFDIKQNGIAISNFISIYGPPSRYLVSSGAKDPDFLVYDLPSGHSVALYVGKPPSPIFSAAVIIDASGNLVRLIK